MGLLRYFEGLIYSSYEIGSWKPDPDLFLLAASQLGVAPEHCAVIEDSIPGVWAGIAAGMGVFGFEQANETDSLTSEDVKVFHAMEELPSILQQVATEVETN